MADSRVPLHGQENHVTSSNCDRENWIASSSHSDNRSKRSDRCQCVVWSVVAVALGVVAGMIGLVMFPDLSMDMSVALAKFIYRPPAVLRPPCPGAMQPVRLASHQSIYLSLPRLRAKVYLNGVPDSQGVGTRGEIHMSDPSLKDPMEIAQVHSIDSQPKEVDDFPASTTLEESIPENQGKKTFLAQFWFLVVTQSFLALRRLVRSRAKQPETDDGAGDAEMVLNRKVFPCGDDLDREISKLAWPAITVALIFPITNSADLFFIGQLGSALAIAGQAAANQAFSFASMFFSVIPVVTSPRVARAKARGDDAEVQEAVGEAIFLSTTLSTVLAFSMLFAQKTVLSLFGNPEGLKFSMPYLFWRLPGLIFEAIASIGFGAIRAVKDPVASLQISVAANLINVMLDPVLMFKKLSVLPGGSFVRGAGLGIAGAALATTISQLFSAVSVVSLLLRKKLVRSATIFRLPSRASLRRLVGAAGAAQIRTFALTAAYVAITKAVQQIDSTGVAAAAHAVTIQLWLIGGVILFALSSVASILIPANMAKKNGGPVAARATANRMLAWGGIMGVILGLAQIAALPLLNVFTPLPEVRRAARLPSILGALLQGFNGIIFVGEGVMVGLQSFVPLAAAQVVATTVLYASFFLGPGGRSLPAVWTTFYLFNGIRFANVIRHHFFTGPLVPRNFKPGVADSNSEAELVTTT